MRTGLILIAALAALPALASERTAPALSKLIPADVETIKETYQCIDGQPFEVTYLNSDPNYLAIVPVEGEYMVFVNTVAASGSRYVAGPYEWWVQGESATLGNAMSEDHPQVCQGVIDG